MLTSISSFGQFNFGIKGGPSYVNVRVIDTKGRFGKQPDYKWRPSYHLGIFNKYKFPNRSAVLIEVIFSDKGFKGAASTIHIGYLNVSVSFRYPIFKKISIEAGGDYGNLVFANANYHGKTSDVKDYFGNESDLGILGGFIYDFNDRLSLNIRYMHGLSNVLNKDATVHFSQGDSQTFYDMGLKYTNQSLYLSVAYIIKRSKKD